MGFYPWSHKTVLSRGVVRSRDKLKPLYLHYHSAHGHQTWQDDSLPRWAPTYQVTSTFNHVVLRDHVTNKKHHISNTTVPMVTKVGRMVT